MSVAQIKVWCNRFKDGRTSVESNERSGRPSTCHNDVIIEEVKTLIMANRRPQIAFRGAETSSS